MYCFAMISYFLFVIHIILTKSGSQTDSIQNTSFHIYFVKKFKIKWWIALLRHQIINRYQTEQRFPYDFGLVFAGTVFTTIARNLMHRQTSRSTIYQCAGTSKCEKCGRTLVQGGSLDNRKHRYVFARVQTCQIEKNIKAATPSIHILIQNKYAK